MVHWNDARCPVINIESSKLLQAFWPSVISRVKYYCLLTIFQVTYMVERFSEPENSTPRPQKSHAKLQIIPRKRTSKQDLRKVKFNCVMSKKVVKRYAKNKQKLRRKLVIDLSKVKAQ